MVWAGDLSLDGCGVQLIVLVKTGRESFNEGWVELCEVRAVRSYWSYLTVRALCVV